MRMLALLLWSLFMLTLSSPAEEDAGIEAVPAVRVQPKEIPRTFAPESQFTAYGNDGDQRVELFRFAEQTRKAVLAALAQKTKTGKINVDKGRLPIILQLRDQFVAGTAGVKGSIRLMPDDSVGLHLQIASGGGFDHAVVHDELVRWLLVDLMLRRVRAENLATAGILKLPDWLHQGLLELMSYQEKGRPSESFASVFRLGKTLTIEEILNADINGMDGVSMTIYRVSSCALLLTLLEQPNGADHLLNCLADLPANQGPITQHLAKYFPVLSGGPKELEKWWSLGLATFAEPTHSELMTMLQTEAALAEALVFEYQPVTKNAAASSPKLFNAFKKKKEVSVETETKPATPAVKAPVQEFAPLLTHPDAHNIAAQTSLALTKLLLRAHPFYRSLINDYQKQIARIGQHKGSGVADGLTELAVRRQKMLTDAKATEDYLDWFEATQRENFSGTFQQYLESANELDHPAPARQDGISRYLDALEKEYAPVPRRVVSPR